MAARRGSRTARAIVAATLVVGVAACGGSDAPSEADMPGPGASDAAAPTTRAGAEATENNVTADPVTSGPDAVTSTYQVVAIEVADDVAAAAEIERLAANGFDQFGSSPSPGGGVFVTARGLTEDQAAQLHVSISVDPDLSYQPVIYPDE